MDSDVVCVTVVLHRTVATPSHFTSVRNLDASVQCRVHQDVVLTDFHLSSPAVVTETDGVPGSVVR